MDDALTSTAMSPQLLKVAERARREPQAKFHSLAHLIDAAALERAYHRQRSNAAVGVDGITKEQYGQNLEDNLRNLHERLRAKRYRHQPIRRVYIPKDQGRRMRPIGISAFEDKLVQDALREVLEAIYEQDFLESSFGFRPQRSAHDAIRTLNRAIYRREVNWVLEADIESFFDSVDRPTLLGMLQKRVPDGALWRLIGKCLRAGVLDGEDLSWPERGMAQGSALSPLLGNIYLHYVLDLWFEQEVRPRMRGKAQLIRFADDFIMCFERQDDARRVMSVLDKRMKKFGLSLHPEKTRLLPFQCPSANHKGKGPGTFDFLGFTLYWQRARSGRWEIACKTRRARLRRAIKAAYDWCRSYRHLPVRQQHAALVRRIRGHFNYFGVNGNTRSLVLLDQHVKRAWFKWLCRRSHRARLNWERFTDLLRDYPLPTPRVYVQIWERKP
ncbi:MAG: group II intron reverse transcriptase/maturase [Phycisphaerae bacterium]|nr:group II intron reverse transcriptase/maturase [Phycisphaerae bacterium]